MSSLQGFRCRRCGAEFLARPPERNREPYGTDWTAPLLCCGLSLRRLPPDQVLSARLPRPRHVCCPGCGYSVRIVIRPDGPLTCGVCRREFQVPAEEDLRATREGTPGALPRREVV